MAKTNKIVEEGVQTDYTSVIVSYSNGIDSTGALYWALREFPKEKIFLLYCDTGFEYLNKHYAATDPAQITQAFWQYGAAA